MLKFLENTKNKVVLELTFPDPQTKTTIHFWDCECGDIKPKSEPWCRECGSNHDECSDSHLNEVIVWLAEESQKETP